MNFMPTPHFQRLFLDKIMRVLIQYRLSTLILVLGLLVTATAFAQPVTLNIKDNQVYVNGKLLAEEDLPDSLQLNGINLKHYFPENDTPTFQLNGQYYMIESGKIRTIPAPIDRDNRTTVIYRKRSAPAPSGTGNEGSVEMEETYYEYSTAADPVSNVMHQYVTEIGAQAQQLQGMREVSSNQDASNILDQLMMQAQEAQQIAQNMADMQFQQYLSMVQQQDRELYNRLVREYELENETLKLAYQARQTTDPAQREQIISDLTIMLDEIFELKQQNRREEIIQLENQLQLLQNRLQQREDMREEIIQRRVTELVGN